MKKLLVLLALTAAFAACKKEEAAPVEETAPAMEEGSGDQMPADMPADEVPAEEPAAE